MVAVPRTGTHTPKKTTSLSPPLAAAAKEVALSKVTAAKLGLAANAHGKDPSHPPSTLATATETLGSLASVPHNNAILTNPSSTPISPHTSVIVMLTVVLMVPRKTNAALVPPTEKRNALGKECASVLSE